MRSLKAVFLVAAAWLVVCAAPAWSQCPDKTVVQDTLLNADGSPAAGRVVVAWPTFLAGDCQVIAGQVTVSVAGGALNVELFPNDGAVPAGTSYRVTYYLKSGRVSTEYWVVPASAAPVALSVVRSTSIPVPTMMFSQGQVTNLVSDLSRKVELPSPCPAGKFLQSTGSEQVNCVDGTGAPLATPTVSGTVKTDVTDADPRVYLQSTTDTLLAAKAALSHTHPIADVTSLQAALDGKQAQDADLDALAALSGTGFVRRTGAATFVVTSASGTGVCPANQVAIQLNDAAAPTCVALTAAYIPALDATKITTGTFADARISQSSVAQHQSALALAASQITSGTLASARLPNPAAGSKGGVEAKTCSGTDKLSAIGTDGVPVCSTDETSGAGGGITSLGGQTGATQTFTHPDDTNVVLTITSATNNHELAMSWTGQLAPARGGTGANNTATSGRYLKGDGTNFVTSNGPASGAGGCTNQFVRTLNSDAAPTCTTVALAADVSGTLPVANGGTGATSFTAGALLFGNGTSPINTDSANLFWDNTNKRLGIGTNQPSAPLHIFNPSGVVGAIIQREGGQVAQRFSVYSSGATFHSGQFEAWRGRGTVASPAAVNAGDFLFAFNVGGQFNTGSSDFVTDAARLQFVAEGTWSSTSRPVSVRIATTPSGSTTASERVRYPEDGGMRLLTAAKPTCDSSRRGTFFYVAGGAGVKDTVEVCAKDASDTYGWRTIY